MIVISNTSPLNYLVLIEEIELLPKLFGQITIPQAVLHELRRPETPDAVREWANVAPSWLQVRAVSVIDPMINLGTGETEAISLANELHADLVLLDDRKARNLALARGLSVVGTLNILEAAAVRELADLPSATIRLLHTNFRAPADLVKTLIEQDAARRKQRQTAARKNLSSVVLACPSAFLKPAIRNSQSEIGWRPTAHCSLSLIVNRIAQ